MDPVPLITFPHVRRAPFRHESLAPSPHRHQSGRDDVPAQAPRLRAAGKKVLSCAGLVMSAGFRFRELPAETHIDGFVEKPFDLAALVAAVERCIGPAQGRVVEHA